MKVRRGSWFAHAGGCALLMGCGGAVSTSENDPSDEKPAKGGGGQAVANAGGTSTGGPSTTSGSAETVTLDSSLCVAAPLPRDSQTRLADCRMLVALPDSTDLCVAHEALSVLDTATAASFRERHRIDVTYPVCELQQLALAPGGSCASLDAAGWCYVDGPAGTECVQSVRFAQRTTPVLLGAIVEMICRPQTRQK